ncbi:MAG: hypothetical protein ACLT1A_00230 [Dysosmobacter sp.]
MDDDSTGGSLKAMEALVQEAGGVVTGKVAVLAEATAADRTDIKFLKKLPLFNADGTVEGLIQIEKNQHGTSPSMIVSFVHQRVRNSPKTAESSDHLGDDHPQQQNRVGRADQSRTVTDAACGVRGWSRSVNRPPL